MPSGYSRHELFAVDLVDFSIDSSEQLAAISDALIDGPAHTPPAQLHREGGSTLTAVIGWRALRVVDNWTIVGVISVSQTGKVTDADYYAARW